MPQIATNVLRILGAAVVEGSKVSSIGQLDHKLYVEADKVLQAAGGKWNRAAKAHIFEGDAAEALDSLRDGEVSNDLPYCNGSSRRQGGDHADPA